MIYMIIEARRSSSRQRISRNNHSVRHLRRACFGTSTNRNIDNVKNKKKEKKKMKRAIDR